MNTKALNDLADRWAELAISEAQSGALASLTAKGHARRIAAMFEVAASLRAIAEGEGK